MENSIELKGISKKYKDFSLKNIDVVIPKGSIVGLIGENGAGKTTIIKSILDIIKPDVGEVKVFGKTGKQIRKDDIGVVLDGAFFAEILSVGDIPKCMKGIYKNWDTPLFQNYLKAFKIPEKQVIKTLSKGMHKKLEIATALSHHPRLLILDEPTSGLDPVVRSEILDIFLEFIQEEENSILLSTHITSDLEHIADYITLIDNGEVLFSKTRDTLVEEYGIIRCDENTFHSLDTSMILCYKKNTYNYDVLTDQKRVIQRIKKDLVIDIPTIEDIMLLYIKGERV